MGTWEPVYAFVEWDRGPRSGIAQVAGRPCVYDSDWTDLEADQPRDSTFHVMPITAAELASVVAVLADQRQHPDWGGRAFASGTGYPNLMGDVAPFGPLWVTLITRLREQPAQWLRMAGEFRPVGHSDVDLMTRGHDWVPLEARWVPVPGEASEAEPTAAPDPAT